MSASRKKDCLGRGRAKFFTGQIKLMSRGFADPEQAMQDKERATGKNLNLTPISDLDLMIKNGWGDTPQVDLPADWRTRSNGAK